MNDAAIARAGGHAKFGKLLDEKNVLPAVGECFRDGAADNAAANDQNVDLVHQLIGYDRKAAAKFERVPKMIGVKIPRLQGLDPILSTCSGTLKPGPPKGV